MNAHINLGNSLELAWIAVNPIMIKLGKFLQWNSLIRVAVRIRFYQ